jgi:hypothetical protein
VARAQLILSIVPTSTTNGKWRSRAKIGRAKIIRTQLRMTLNRVSEFPVPSGAWCIVNLTPHRHDTELIGQQFFRKPTHTLRRLPA